MKKTQGNIVIILLIAIVVAAIIIYFGFFKKAPVEMTKGISLTETPTPSPTPLSSWESQIPNIKPIILNYVEDNFNSPYEIERANRQNFTVFKEADITGDGTPEAFINLGFGGASSEFLLLFELKNGKPVLSEVKDKNGKISVYLFQAGGSASHGEIPGLDIETRSVYQVRVKVDSKENNDGNFTSTYACNTEAFVWNKESGIFMWNESVSTSINERECAKLK